MRRVDHRIAVKFIGLLAVYHKPISVGKQAST